MDLVVRTTEKMQYSRVADAAPPLDETTASNATFVINAILLCRGMRQVAMGLAAVSLPLYLGGVLEMTVDQIGRTLMLGLAG